MNRIANKGLLLLLTALLLFPVFFPAPAATADEVVEDVLLDEEDVAEETAEEDPSAGVENVPTTRAISTSARTLRSIFSGKPGADTAWRSSRTRS